MQEGAGGMDLVAGPGMRCWACPRSIGLGDVVKELPIVGTLVHAACYVRETGEAVRVAPTLRQYLRARELAAA